MRRRTTWCRRVLSGLSGTTLLVALAVGGVPASAGAAGTSETTGTNFASPVIAPEHGTHSSGCGQGPTLSRAALGRPLPYQLATSGATYFNAPSAPKTSTISGSYVVTLPEDYTNRRPSPLVLLFYGYASNPAQVSALTDLPTQGARAGDIVVVPHTQSSGPTAEWQFSGTGTDAMFVATLINHLEQDFCINPERVFATGFSAGAAFSIVYACAHPGQLAAIATVAVDFQLGCTKPLSIMAFHGTADPEVPYQNGAVGLSLPGVKVRGTELNLGDWARLDRCAPSPTSTRLGTQVRRQQWHGCGHGTAVSLFSIIGGGHTWPGADPARGTGLTTQQVRATAQILRFFATTR